MNEYSVTFKLDGRRRTETITGTSAGNVIVKLYNKHFNGFIRILRIEQIAPGAKEGEENK